MPKFCVHHSSIFGYLNISWQQNNFSILKPPLTTNWSSRFPSTTKTLLCFLNDDLRINPIMNLIESFCRLDIVFILIVNLNRNYLYLTQTPQGFDFKELLNLQNIKNFKATDDANYFIKANKKIKFVNGENENEKITYKSDIVKNHNIKYGIGFDVHRLVPKRKLYLGGLRIKSNLGTLGHSDGDPVLHAIIDSILGACKMGDIGEWFSDKNKKFKNIRSTILLKKIINEIKKKSYFINNIDINIITQTPNISKYKNKIVKTISNICELSPNKINIKGKTTEKLGLIGKEKAIACEVITSVTIYE